MKNKTIKKKRGFTLIELVVVIAIMAILGLIIVPNLTAYMDRADKAKTVANIKTVQTGANLVLTSEPDITMEDFVTDEKINDKAADRVSKITNFTKKQLKELKYTKTNDGQLVVSGELTEETTPPKPVEKPIYTVVFMVDGVEFSKQTVNEGDSASLPTEIPIKEGYKFLGWEAVEIEGVKQNLSIMSRWKMMTDDDYLATDADFSGNANGEFKYIGNEKIVKIPHKIKGVNITSYKEMFKGTSVEKVISDNINITTLDQMFYYTNSNFLDVSQLDTRNVTNFGMLFSNSKAKKIIGLNKLNTSKVTTMYNMFAGISVESLDLSNFDTRKVDPSIYGLHFMFNNAKIETLDLSSFDTSRFSKLPIMFNGAEVTNAYARNQTEANKFNATEYNTIKTRFIVKP